MPSTVLPIIVTPDIERALRFYLELLDAKQVERVPEDGPAFYVGLRAGDSELGLVADDVPSGPDHRGRVLLSLAWTTSTACCRGSRSSAARRPTRRTTCRGDSGWHTSPTRTATPST